MKKIAAISILLSGLVFSACANQQSVAEKPLASQEDGPKFVRRPKGSSSVPTLTITQQDQENSEYPLRVQLARYTNPQKSEIEVILSDNTAPTCDLIYPKLFNDESRLKFVISADNQQEQITIQDYTNNENFTVSAELQDANQSKEITEINQFTVENINDAIIRGNLDINTDQGNLQGEYFARICNETYERS